MHQLDLFAWRPEQTYAKRPADRERRLPINPAADFDCYNGTDEYATERSSRPYRRFLEPLYERNPGCD